MHDLTFSGLILQAFLAATILPFSSEAGLIAALKLDQPIYLSVLACSLGNCLACLINYGLGYAFKDKLHNKLTASYGGRKALALSDRYLNFALLLSWLPVIGDPLTIIAGMLKTDLKIFILLVFGLRIGRYVLIAWLAA